MTRLIAWIPLALLCAACCFGGPAGTGGPLAPAAPLGPPIEVPNVCAIETAYQANEVAATSTYPTGALMNVSGIVDSVQLSMGDTIIHPRGGCMFMSLALAPTETGRAGTLSPGTPFRMQCTMGTYFMSVRLEACRFVD